ncbi:hypothetical protein DVB69_10625 [Sporosarcina sp. BI001-red]|uniref:hypothetical protein n=1 Tax=Sporosarcina sp. BI001-red TaxID=2282866 RepID=UPI000E27EA0D|nr:hypothetical protein [Sporosarcina sp. BI001-red]REB07293.1 hypothetical protein DVB69_10625 [Sporosarcina sp. BI001-red]
MRKQLVPIILLLTTALFLAGCADAPKQNDDSDRVEENQSTENQDSTKVNDSLDKVDHKAEVEAKLDSDQSGSDTSSSNETSSKETNDTNNKVNTPLSDYSSKEIEFARIWLQFGANQDVDRIYAQHIPSGKPLNSNDESTVNYPEDVVQLSGTRLVDGVVTYSSNGDGTINIYNVPKRWDGHNPAGEEFYKKIIEDTERRSVDLGEDEKVEQLIRILELD